MGCKESKAIHPDDPWQLYGSAPYTTGMFDEHIWWRFPENGVGEPWSIPELFESLERLDQKLSDPQRFISKGDRNLKALIEIMDLGYRAKELELRSIQCQVLCFQKLAEGGGANTSAWERFILDYEIAEVKARATSEVIDLIVPGIYSHPIRAKEYKRWKKFMEDHKKWRNEEKTRCEVARKK